MEKLVIVGSRLLSDLHRQEKLNFEDFEIFIQNNEKEKRLSLCHYKELLSQMESVELIMKVLYRCGCHNDTRCCETLSRLVENKLEKIKEIPVNELLEMVPQFQSFYIHSEAIVQTVTKENFNANNFNLRTIIIGEKIEQLKPFLWIMDYLTPEQIKELLYFYSGKNGKIIPPHLNELEWGSALEVDFMSFLELIKDYKKKK